MKVFEKKIKVFVKVTLVRALSVCHHTRYLIVRFQDTNDVVHEDKDNVGVD